MRYARICPNTLRWSLPSGGNKGGPNSFPGKSGFGFEEWLLGSPIIQGGDLNGFTAGFIQGYKKQIQNFVDDVTLYYLDANLNRISAIEIMQCRRLTQIEATNVYAYYSNTGFLNAMRNDLGRLNLVMPANLQPLDIFNVAFLPNSVNLLSPQTQCLRGHTYYTHLYR